MIYTALSGSVGQALTDLGIDIGAIASTTGKITEEAINAIEKLNEQNAELKTLYESGGISSNDYYDALTNNIMEIQKWSGTTSDTSSAIEEAHKNLSNIFSQEINWDSTSLEQDLQSFKDSAENTKKTITEAYSDVIKALEVEKANAELTGNKEAVSIFTNAISATESALQIELLKVDNMLGSFVDKLQEDLAEKLDVSRQAISRWESGTAMPDANNILQLSKLFGVTTDYLLNDDYQSDNDLPKVKEVQNDNLGQIMIYLVTLEVMVLLMQFMTTVILQNVFFGFLSFIPFVVAIGGFEYSYQKKASSATEKTKNFRRKFYKISAWLGLYFPIRFIISVAARFYPRPYNTLVLEVIILVIYIAAATCVNLSIDKSYLLKEQ